MITPSFVSGHPRAKRASEYLVPLGGAKRDDLGTLQGILDESDGPKSIRPSVSDPQLDMSDSLLFPCSQHLPNSVKRASLGVCCGVI